MTTAAAMEISPTIFFGDKRRVRPWEIGSRLFSTFRAKLFSQRMSLVLMLFSSESAPSS